MAIDLLIRLADIYTINHLNDLIPPDTPNRSQMMLSKFTEFSQLPKTNVQIVLKLDLPENNYGTKIKVDKSAPNLNTFLSSVKDKYKITDSNISTEDNWLSFNLILMKEAVTPILKLSKTHGIQAGLTFSPIRHLSIVAEFLQSSKTFNASIGNFAGVFLPPHKNCQHCSSKLSFSGDQKTIFYPDGPKQGVIIKGYCRNCRITFWPAFEDQSSRRRYFLHSSIFGITQETWFSFDLLIQVWDHISLADSTFVGFQQAYNEKLIRTNVTPHLNHSLLEDNTLAFKTLEIMRELSSDEYASPSWNVCRDMTRNLRMEDWFKVIFLDLKDSVNARWLPHLCRSDMGCFMRWIVVDGDQKTDRPECKHEELEKEESEELPAVFLRNKCHNQPNLKSNSGYCKEHEDSIHAPTKSPDLILRPTTRSFVASLPDCEITTSDGCKDEENITKYLDRTAGMFWMYRPCGIRLNNQEMYTCESLSQLLVFLYDTVGEHFTQIRHGLISPLDCLVKGLCYDRACDVLPFLNNLARKQNWFAALLFLIWMNSCMVDKFHAGGHVKPVCVISSELCQYHPSLPKFSHLFESEDCASMNTEIAEQSFRKINKSKYSTKYMSPFKRLVYFKILDHTHNIRLERKISSKNLLGPGNLSTSSPYDELRELNIRNYKEDDDKDYEALDDDDDDEKMSTDSSESEEELDMEAEVPINLEDSNSETYFLRSSC